MAEEKKLPVPAPEAVPLHRPEVVANVFCCSSIDHVSIYSVEFINRIVF